METKLLRKPWVQHALCSLLDSNRQPCRSGVVPQALVQLIQVEGPTTAIVSDRFHYIRATFTASCLEAFANRRVRLGTTTTQPCARSLHAINGSFLRLRNFHFKFTADGTAVALLVQAFDFVGAEQTYTCGEPADVHIAALVRRFKAALPKGWSYQMDRGVVGFSMCDYNDCEIPPEQQALLDDVGWAFPTASGATARPGSRREAAAASAAGEGSAAGSAADSGVARGGSESSSEEWPTGGDAMLSTQAAAGAAASASDDGLVSSPPLRSSASQLPTPGSAFALIDSEEDDHSGGSDSDGSENVPVPHKHPAAAASTHAARTATAAAATRLPAESSEEWPEGSQMMLATQAPDGSATEDEDATQGEEDEDEEEEEVAAATAPVAAVAEADEEDARQKKRPRLGGLAQTSPAQKAHGVVACAAKGGAPAAVDSNRGAARGQQQSTSAAAPRARPSCPESAMASRVSAALSPAATAAPVAKVAKVAQSNKPRKPAAVARQPAVGSPAQQPQPVPSTAAVTKKKKTKKKTLGKMAWTSARYYQNLAMKAQGKAAGAKGAAAKRRGGKNPAAAGWGSSNS